MACGTILRQALQYDTVAAVILYDESQPDSTKDQAVQLKEVDVTKPQSGNGVFWKFFGWINKGSFEVSADAFTTFRVSLLSSLVYRQHALTAHLLLLYLICS
jgi:calcium binding protein 39